MSASPSRADLRAMFMDRAREVAANAPEIQADDDIALAVKGLCPDFAAFLRDRRAGQEGEAA